MQQEFPKDLYFYASTCLLFLSRSDRVSGDKIDDDDGYDDDYDYHD